MNRVSLSRFKKGTHHDHCATASEFQNLFATEKREFYCLAFLIITDSAKAEECLVEAMNDCAYGSSVSKEWMRSWARRVVIRSAIRIAGELQGERSVISSAHACLAANSKAQEIEPYGDGVSSGVLALPNFERIVFVLCVLEHYLAQDCALLLGRLQQDVQKAQLCAIERIAMHEHEDLHHEVNLTSSVCLCSEKNEEWGDANDSCGTLLHN